MVPTCSLDGDFQVEQDNSTFRRSGGVGVGWERQNHTISFHDRDLEEARGTHYDFSLIGNTPWMLDKTKMVAFIWIWDLETMSLIMLPAPTLHNMHLLCSSKLTGSLRQYNPARWMWPNRIIHILWLLLPSACIGKKVLLYFLLFKCFWNLTVI